MRIVQNENTVEEKKGPIEWFVNLVTGAENEKPGERKIEQDPGAFRRTFRLRT